MSRGFRGRLPREEPAVRHAECSSWRRPRNHHHVRGVAHHQPLKRRAPSHLPPVPSRQCSRLPGPRLRERLQNRASHCCISCIREGCKGCPLPGLSGRRLSLILPHISQTLPTSSRCSPLPCDARTDPHSPAPAPTSASSAPAQRLRSRQERPPSPRLKI